MEKVLSVHEKKGTKHGKTKKTKPVKIVYISNPMKVNATASEFRALVQELTGRDSVMPAATKYPEIDDSDEIIPREDHGHAVYQVPVLEPVACQVPTKRFESDHVAFEEPYDDVFVPQISENFTGFFPSNLFCGSPQVDVLRNL